MDAVGCLFDHLRDRLPVGYDYGDDNNLLVNDIYNHQVFQQSIREDHEGDVGIFEIYTTEQPKYSGYTCYVSEVQVVCVCINGDIEKARKYLMKALDNFRDDDMSEHVYVKSCKLINLKPLGKNSSGLQMVVLNIKLKYLID